MEVRKSLIAGLLTTMFLAGCGGGAGGGGDSDQISLNVSSLNFVVVGTTPTLAQNVTVTFTGMVAVAGYGPKVSPPDWLTISGPGNTSTHTVTFQLAAHAPASGKAGSYTTKVRFATGTSVDDLTDYVDLSVTMDFRLQQGMTTSVRPMVSTGFADGGVTNTPLAAANVITSSGTKSRLLYDRQSTTLYAVDPADNEIERFNWNGSSWTTLPPLSVPGILDASLDRPRRELVAITAMGLLRMPLEVAGSLPSNLYMLTEPLEEYGLFGNFFDVGRITRLSADAERMYTYRNPPGGPRTVDVYSVNWISSTVNHLTTLPVSANLGDAEQDADPAIPDTLAMTLADEDQLLFVAGPQAIAVLATP